MAQKLNSTQRDTHAISVSMSANWAVPTTNTAVNFNTTDFQIGTKLTRSGTGVVVGTGVTHIRVSYTLMTDGGAGASYIFTNLYKNAVSMSQVIDANSSQFKSVSETKIIAATSGDVITVQASTGAGASNARGGTATTMTVEVVA